MSELIPEAKNEIVVYQPNETVRLEVMVKSDTVWLNCQQLARLFGRDVKTIGKHIANALRDSNEGRMLFLSLYPVLERLPTKSELYQRCHEMGDIVVAGLGLV